MLVRSMQANSKRATKDEKQHILFSQGMQIIISWLQVTTQQHNFT
jgi:hypothetical protein